MGLGAGTGNTTGVANTAAGALALASNTTGGGNTVIGALAGLNNITGSQNVYIANEGPLSGNESGAIRIGDPANQTGAYMAGIVGSSTNSGVPVFIDPTSGRLGTGGGSVSFSQVTGTVTNSQLVGQYTNAMQLSNTANVLAGNFNGTGTGTFSGNFTGNGAGLIGVASGLAWPIVTKSGDYVVQLSDFSTVTTEGKFLILIGNFTVPHTFTLPNPPPPNGSCVAIGNLAHAGINSNANTFLKVTASPLTVDADPALNPTQARRTSYLYCSDRSNYFRLGYQQNGVSEIGPWLKTADTGTVNAMTTTFRNGMDFNLADGSVIFLLPKFANTSNIVTLNVNGLGAFKILRYGNQGLAPGDLSPNAYALLIYNSAGTKWELLNPQSTQTLSGTTANIGGSLVAAGTCATGTASVTGATVGHPVAVSASDGSLPNGAIILSAAVTASNMVTVQLCAVADVTPAAKTYNVATQ